MDDMLSAGYMGALLLIAPGFIAKQAADWTGNASQRKKDGLEFLMSYFVYSLFAVFFSALALIAAGLLPWRVLTTDLLAAVGSNARALLVAAAIIAVSFLTGIVWQLLAKPAVTKTLNWVNERAWGLHVENATSLMESFIKDEKDKERLLVVIRNGQETAGLFLGRINEYGTTKEIALTPVHNWQEYVEMARTNPSNDLGIWKKRVYLDFANDLTVEEYECPEGFFAAK